MRVLIVDDYPGAAEIACVLVRLLGHEAQPARTGAQALAMVAELEPDVIVLDLGLPDLDGYEVARRIRQRPGKRPFIAALTGLNDTSDRDQSLAAGIDMYAVKPASAELLGRILAAAERASSERGGPDPA